MSETELNEQVAAAAAYEQLHVPALFQEWVDPVLDAARVGSGDRVLDVACGSGVLARGAHARVGPAGYVAGLDPGPGMLAVAGDLQPAIDWRPGVAEALPFDDGTFDAVVSQFGMMFFVDRIEAIREMLRVLGPAGRLAVAVWDGLDNQPAYKLEVELLEELAGKPAADALRAPFVLGDAGELKALFEGAGVESITVSTRIGQARFPGIRSMVEADLRGWLPIMGVDLSDDLIGTILEHAETALARFVDVSGTVVFDSPAHIVAGRAGTRS